MGIGIAVIRISDAKGLRGARFSHLQKAIRNLPVGEQISIVAPTEELRLKAYLTAVREAGLSQATLTLEGGEEQVALKERPGCIGLWRESRGHWTYLRKHSQVVPYSGPTAEELLDAAP